MKSNFKYVLYGLSYLRKFWMQLVFILVISVVSMVLSLIPIEILRRLIDIAIPNKDLAMVFNMILVVFAVHLVLLVAGYVQDLMMTRLQMNITRKLQGDFFNRLLHLPATDYAHFNEGQLMERVLDDTEETVDSTFDLVLSPILEIVSVIITIVYMFLVSPRLTFVALAFVPVFIIVTFSVNRIVRRKYSVIKNAYANVYKVVQEKLASIKEIITHNKSDYETKDLARNIKSYQDFRYDYEKFSLKLGSITSIIADIAPYTILLYATYLIIEGSFEIGTLMAFSMLMPRLFDPVEGLAGKELEFQTLGVTAKRVFGVLHDAKIIPEGKEKLNEGDVRGEIEFKNISFDYPEVKLFNNFNLKVEPDQLIAIVGGEGVGKSSLFNLLLRTVRTKKGKIFLDGKDISKYKTDSLRHHIAIVNQKPVLFSDTVLYNIVYGHPESKAAMKDVFNVANMVNIHKSILRLPKGYKTHIDEASGRLSAGETHRITIARAIIRNPKILLLDDPTAGLDAESVQHLVNSLENLKKGRTILVITKDVNVVKKADSIIVLDRKGNTTFVKEVGRHETLLKDKLYRELLS